MPKNLPNGVSSQDHIAQYLIQRQRAIEEQIKLIESSDPLLTEAVAEASEPGTDSWQADVHAKSVTLKNHLSDLSSRVKRALIKLELGTYGKCDHCGKEIDPQRMRAIPIATLCTFCVAISPLINKTS